MAISSRDRAMLSPSSYVHKLINLCLFPALRMTLEYPVKALISCSRSPALRGLVREELVSL